MSQLQYMQVVEVSLPETLNFLKAFRFEQNDFIESCKHEMDLWLKAEIELHDYLNHTVPHIQRDHAWQKLLDVVEGAVRFYRQILTHGKLDSDASEDRNIVAFAREELHSYCTNEDQARRAAIWCADQGINYDIDSVTVGTRQYFRVLSKPILKTQTSKSGVVFRKNEIIDVPTRPIVTLAKALERGEQYLGQLHV